MGQQQLVLDTHSLHSIPLTPHALATMSKGTRFISAAIPTLVLYLLLLAQVFPTPFLSADVAGQVLPVVSLAGRLEVLC